MKELTCNPVVPKELRDMISADIKEIQGTCTHIVNKLHVLYSS